jgi:asparagine synthase (glutamine-hydrolysing)
MDELDGAFAAALWDATSETLTLIRDPFGVRSLYYVEHGGAFFFASELKQLCAVASLPVEPDLAAIHKYLTFSFVPGEDVPVRGVKRLLPGHIGTLHNGRFSSRPYFTLEEAIDPALEDQRTAVHEVRRLAQRAVRKRLNGEPKVGLYLSGGLDSSSVAVWLKDAGASVRCYSLDFGAKAVEKAQAEQVAKLLELELELVPLDGSELGTIGLDLAHKLDLPFGDPVTGPQYLLGRAARASGFDVVFNGEGGDQLFGGWTSKPMIAARIYGGMFEDESPEETYLRSYHRFYGLEEDLYSPDFRAKVGAPGQRRAHLTPYLTAGEGSFLNRVRLADISLKGSQNILPRAERLTNAWGLDLRVPLFDRALAQASFRLAPSLKLHGACEKYVLKLAVRQRLPPEIVWRKKFGMSVPVTDWTLAPLRAWLDDLLGARSIQSRGLFRTEYVARLLEGRDSPDEPRRRRVGEKIWALAMLEAWMRVFIDSRGRDPGTRS